MIASRRSSATATHGFDDGHDRWRPVALDERVEQTRGSPHDAGCTSAVARLLIRAASGLPILMGIARSEAGQRQTFDVEHLHRQRLDGQEPLGLLRSL